jgi:hypothetical protein
MIFAESIPASVIALPNILYIMVENIVSAYELCSVEKLDELRYRSFVKRTSIALDTSNVKNLLTFGSISVSTNAIDFIGS